MRHAIARQLDFWDISLVPAGVNAADLDAAAIAKANGGGCGENAYMALYTVNAMATTQDRLRRVGIRGGSDHEFVLIENDWESDDEWVTVDPWPTQSAAVAWTDHFCYTNDRTRIETQTPEYRADGQDHFSWLAELIHLNEAGKFVAQWDLRQMQGVSLIDIAKMMERSGFAINWGEDVTEQVFMILGRRLRTDDGAGASVWSRELLWLWCLSKVDKPVIMQILLQNDRGEHAPGQAISAGLAQATEIYPQLGATPTVYDQQVTTYTNPQYVSSGY